MMDDVFTDAILRKANVSPSTTSRNNPQLPETTVFRVTQVLALSQLPPGTNALPALRGAGAAAAVISLENKHCFTK